MDEALLLLDTAKERIEGHDWAIPITVICRTLQGQHMGTALPSSDTAIETLTAAVHEFVVHDGIQPVSWLLLTDCWLTPMDEVSGAEGDACEALLVAIITADAADDCMITHRYERTTNGLIWHPREFNHGPSGGALPNVLRTSFSYRN